MEYKTKGMLKIEDYRRKFISQSHSIFDQKRIGNTLCIRVNKV